VAATRLEDHSDGHHLVVTSPLNEARKANQQAMVAEKKRM